MDGTIHIKEYPVSCFIGVYPHEKASKQRLFIDIECIYDISQCVANDCLKEGIDYDEILSLLSCLAEEKPICLLETFTFQTIKQISTAFPQLKWLKVKVTKPIPHTQVSCTMEWSP